MALEHHQTMSIEEYLALEAQHLETRYEYVITMAGGTVNLDTIKSKLERMLRALPPIRRYCPYSFDMHASVSSTHYYHHDVTVGCNPGDQGEKMLVQSPRLVLKVLSPGIERTDHREQLREYLACLTSEKYLLVNSDILRIEQYCKEGNKWLYESFGSNDNVELPCRGVQFPSRQCVKM